MGARRPAPSPRSRSRAAHCRSISSMCSSFLHAAVAACVSVVALQIRSEEHTSELQSLMRNSYAVFCLKKKNRVKPNHMHTVTPHPEFINKAHECHSITYVKNQLYSRSS